VTLAAKLLIPATTAGIAIRNVGVRLLPLANKIRETVFHNAIPG
jgi:hypothetical protein